MRSKGPRSSRRKPARTHRGLASRPEFFDAIRVHEIRNHLTALSVSAQLFSRKKHDPEFLGSFERLMTQETERLLELTRRFLERSKVDLEPKAEVDWDPLVEHVLELMRPVFQEQGTVLEVRQGTGRGLRGAACQLESLVLNLVRNGLESAGPGGKVKVASRSRGPFLEFQVWNDGKPIPRQLAREIFKPFFTTKKDGTGLGLAICQWVAENHGGRIEVRSSASGTVFKVVIPLKVSAPRRKGQG